MLTKFIVAIPIIISLFLRFVVVGKKSYKINTLLFIASILVLPIGMFLTVVKSNQLSDHLDNLSRPITTGVVIKSEIVGSEKAYRPEITYQYVIDSNTYTHTTSLNSPMFGNKRKQYDVANVTTAEYPVGRELEVLYDTDNPTDAMLQIPLAWNVYGQIGFGAFLIALSLFGLLMPRKKSWI